MRRMLLLLFACLAVSSIATAQTRQWQDATGKLQVDARFLLFKYDKIWLLRTDGLIFGVTPEELSEADRRFASQLVEQRKAAPVRSTDNPPGRVPYLTGRELCLLEDKQIAESSGLACSRRRPGLFWTHNDSGADARIYLIDEQGRDLGSCELQDTTAFDFEDMMSFALDGKPYLVLCDTGNNGRAAGVHMLYVIEEPEIGADNRVSAAVVPVHETIYMAYEDDHRNCEAVGFDPTSKTFLFATKERNGESYVYALPWPGQKLEKAFPARRIATLKLPAVTGMDVSPDGRRAILCTYTGAFEFARGEDQAWADAFRAEPREIIVPERIQGESVCYAQDGKTLYLTSENLPTPLIVVPVGK